MDDYEFGLVPALGNRDLAEFQRIARARGWDQVAYDLADEEQRRGLARDWAEEGP